MGTLFTADMIYGSGLRNGDANIGTVPAYTQVNAGVSHEFVGYTQMPFTLRFDVVNVFDTIYEIRDGSGIGVFAPQFGPRRGYFAGWSSKL
jgi:outer membrane receptor protein involved in Fe transport